MTDGKFISQFRKYVLVDKKSSYRNGKKVFTPHGKLTVNTTEVNSQLIRKRKRDELKFKDETSETKG